MGTFSLDIKNFQSISDAHLEFIPGINLILGQSNSGKTAILRAINALLSNPTYAKSFVKLGASKATVVMSYEGNEVIWEKPIKGSTTYIVNGEENTKIGSQDLFDLLPINGFVKSESDDIMNIEGEWNLPFPFDRTPAELFKLFENVFCVSDSATLLKSYKEEESDLVKKVNDTKDKIRKAHTKLTALDELEAEIDISKIKGELATFQSDVFTLHQLLDDYTTINKSARLDSFTFADVQSPNQYTLEEALTVERELQFLHTISNKIKFYKTLPETMEIPDTLPEYSSMVADLKVIDLAQVANNVSLDKEVNITGDSLSQYTELMQDLSVIQAGAHADSFKVDEQCTNDFSLSLADYLDLVDDLKVISACVRKGKALTLQVKEIDDRLEVIQNKLKEFKVCPLCGHELVGDKCYA